METLTKSRCRELGISQAELSRRTGLHYTIISMVCNARLNPNPRQCGLISQALETTPEVLWPGLNRKEGGELDGR